MKAVSGRIDGTLIPYNSPIGYIGLYLDDPITFGISFRYHGLFPSIPTLRLDLGQAIDPRFPAGQSLVFG